MEEYRTLPETVNPFRYMDEIDQELIVELVHADLFCDHRFPFRLWNELDFLGRIADKSALVDAVLNTNIQSLRALTEADEYVDLGNLFSYLCQHTSVQDSIRLSSWIKTATPEQLLIWGENFYLVSNTIASRDTPLNIRISMFESLLQCNSEDFCLLTGDYAEILKIYNTAKSSFPQYSESYLGLLERLNYSSYDIEEEGADISGRRNSAVGCLIEQLLKDGKIDLAKKIVSEFQQRADEDFINGQRLSLDLEQITKDGLIAPGVLVIDLTKGQDRHDAFVARYQDQSKNVPSNYGYRELPERIRDFHDVPTTAQESNIDSALLRLLNQGHNFKRQLETVLRELYKFGGQELINEFANKLYENVDKDPRAFLRETSRINKPDSDNEFEIIDGVLQITQRTLREAGVDNDIWSKFGYPAVRLSMEINKELREFPDRLFRP